MPVACLGEDRPMENASICARARTLDTIAKYVSPFADERLARWALQAEARTLLPDERVAHCYRRMTRYEVDVLHDSARLTASYSGLETCSSVWHCPLCASKVSERRKKEIEKAISF